MQYWTFVFVLFYFNGYSKLEFNNLLIFSIELLWFFTFLIQCFSFSILLISIHIFIIYFSLHTWHLMCSFKNFLTSQLKILMLNYFSEEDTNFPLVITAVNTVILDICHFKINVQSISCILCFFFLSCSFIL